MDMEIRNVRAWMRAALLAVIVVFCTSCHRTTNTSQGVQLIFDEANLAPGSSFELRFDNELAAPDETPKAFGAVSPLVITPPVEGEFVWLSQRSGLFTPRQPLGLGVTYLFTLRAGLTTSGGKQLSAKLYQRVHTPKFQLTEYNPRWGDHGNCPAKPMVQIEFNGAVAAAAAASYMQFRSGSGQSVRAVVRQATTNDSFYWSGGSERFHGLTWKERFAAMQNRKVTNTTFEEDLHGTNLLVLNRLVVEPAQLLPPATNWCLLINPGVPCSEYPISLPSASKVLLGTVQPFEARAVETHNTPGAGRSIRVEWTKPMSSEITPLSFTNWITLSNAPADLKFWSWGTTLALSGSFELNHAYWLSIKKGFPAADDSATTARFTQRLTFEPIAPRLYFPVFESAQLSAGRRQMELLALNVRDIRVRAKLLDRHTLIHALRGYETYFKRNNWRWDNYEPFQEVDFNLVPGETIFDKRFSGSNLIDESHRIELPWDAMLEEKSAGALFLVAEDNGSKHKQQASLGAECVVQLTDLGLVWKHCEGGLQVFVFSYKTGAPSSNVVLRLCTDENKALAEVVTDESGLARLPAHERAAWIMAEAGADLHAVRLSQNVPLYSFHIPVEYSDDRQTRKVLLFTDRPVYQPGETVHCKAIVRDWSETSFEVPANLSGRLRCLDAKSKICFETNVILSAFGSFDQSIPLPRNVRGQYQLDFNFGEGGCQHYFQVQEYQPNAFEVRFDSKQTFWADEGVELLLSAKYYMGKNLSRAKVHWSIEAWDEPFHPEGFEDFTFGVNDWNGRNSLSLSLQGEALYTGETNLVIAPQITTNPLAPQPRSVQALAEVTDLNQQTISKGIRFTRHSSDFYLGLQSIKELIKQGSPIPIGLIALRPDGTPCDKPVRATVQIQHVEWRSVPRQGAGRAVSYQSEAVYTPIAEMELSTLTPKKVGQKWEIDPSGRNQSVIAERSGSYVIRVQGEDDDGRTVACGAILHVRGEAELAWDYRNDAQMELVPDSKTYLAGQTAVLLAKAPFSGYALVTVEREEILRSFVTRIEGNAPEIRIPLQKTDAPNVFVSVMLVRGADQSKKRFPRPESRLGYCQLVVEHPDTKLEVTVKSERTDYRPGDYVDVVAEIKDPQAHAISDAEVTLYAVDEGVLSLSEYNAPQAHSFFYDLRPLAVHTGSSLSHLMPEDPEQFEFHNKGYLIGGGGRNGRLRRKFLGCAFWQASLRTDADGRVRANFVAPDSLTRYRLIAVAHTQASQFGTGEGSFEINKPLMIEPALPRFANVTDQITARALVHNQSRCAAAIQVSLQLDDKAVVVGASTLTNSGCTTIIVPTNGSLAVEFPLRFENAGTAKWIWKAHFADGAADPFSDAVQSTLEVGYVTPLLREVYLARNEAAITNLLEKANPQLLEGKGTVTVTLCNSRLGQLAEAISQLLHYPYGCVEQTSSSLLPWIVLRDLPSVSASLCRPSDEIQAAVAQGIDRLLSMQTSSGGLSYWPGAADPMLWGSAYGGMVLTLARAKGFDVPPGSLDHLLNYLSEELRSTHQGEQGYGLSDRCLALYTLALAGRAEPAYHELLSKTADQLSVDNRVLLGLAILESKGPVEMAEQLLRPGRAQEANDWFACRGRTDALLLLGQLLRNPKHPSIDVLVEQLVHHQVEGHWWTTQGNAWALYALTEYSARVEKRLRHLEGTIGWRDQAHRFTLARDIRTFEKTFDFSPSNALSTLTLKNPSQQLLFTQVKLETRPKAVHQASQDRGFRLDRRYARLDDDGKLQPIDQLRVGDRVLIALKFEVRTPAHYMAIDDPLPSILEAINPEFKSQQTKSGPGSDFFSDFRELRADRALFFRNHVEPGIYTIRYLARVRASGSVTAPPAKIEEMYHPEHFGLSETVNLTSLPLE